MTVELAPVPRWQTNLNGDIYSSFLFGWRTALKRNNFVVFWPVTVSDRLPQLLSPEELKYATSFVVR